MGISLVQDRIKVSSKREALKLHLIIKSFQNHYNLSIADINTLIELNDIGYNQRFFDSCLKKGFYKSEQTVRNAISKMTGLGILTYAKRGERVISESLLPALSEEKVIFKYLVGNLDSDN